MGLDASDCHQLSLRYYKGAAMQGDGDAWVKSGDLLYEGVVEKGFGGKVGRGAKMLAKFILDVVRKKGEEGEGAQPSPTISEIAAEHYKRAADMNMPQAYFNLGYLYQIGDGLEKDFPLAKRYFDLAASSSVDAKIAVELALFAMRMQERAERWRAWWWGEEKVAVERKEVAENVNVKVSEKKAMEEKKAVEEKKAEKKSTRKKEGRKERGQERVRNARSVLEIVSKHVVDLEGVILFLCGGLYLLLHSYRRFVVEEAERQHRLQRIVE